MAIENLVAEETAAGTSRAAAFWGSKDREAVAVLAEVKKCRDAHAQALAKDGKAQPKRVISFVVPVAEANTWKLRIESQLRTYLKDTDADTGIRKFSIENLPGDKRKVSFVPAVLRNYEVK